MNLIIAALTNEKDYLQIDVLSRAQFLSDLHGLAWIGDIEYKVLFEALNLLKHETEYPVWITGLAILSSLRYMLSITDIINPYTVNLISVLLITESTRLIYGLYNIYSLSFDSLKKFFTCHKIQVAEFDLARFLKTF